MPGFIGTTQSHGVSTATHRMDDRNARANAIAQNISNTTSAGEARDLLMEMRDTLRAQNNGDETLLRLVHTTKTDQQMAFQSLNKKWGNSTRTLETKAALIAEFDKAGWDTSELKAYLDPKTTRADRILANEILTILENASAKAETEGPDLRFDASQTTIPWMEETALHAPKLGSGAYGTVQRLKFNGEPMALKTLAGTNLPPTVSLDPQQTTPHIKRDIEVTAAFLKAQTSSVIQPKYFMVKVTPKNGEAEHLMVKGGKDFKEWSKAQLWDSETGRPNANAPTIQITGLAMPLAEGQTLISTIQNKPVDFKQTAESAMNSLAQLARNGFVHGDIKPENLFVKNDGTLRLIDTGSMVKITKRAGEQLIALPDAVFDKTKRAHTSHFTHPGHSPDFKTVGMEQDLFSMGVTLLETKLLNIAKTLRPDDAQEFFEAADEILTAIKEENDNPNLGSTDTIRNEIRSKLEKLKSNYPQAFADGELEWAKGVVNTALAQTKPVVDREVWGAVLNRIPSPQ
jgi:hypothetical protein